MFLWMRCVMLLAACLLRCHRVPDMPVQLTQLFGRRKGKGEISQTFLIPEGQGSLGSPRGSLNPALTPGTFQWCPQRGIREAHMITIHYSPLFRTAYVCTKSCLCGCWKIHQHSFIPQTRNVRPFLAKANCSQTRHCLQGNKQNAGT